jgi:hypothetical protein
MIDARGARPEVDIRVTTGPLDEIDDVAAHSG